MAREFSRSSRVSSQIQRELATVLQREIRDPRLGHVTVNAVKVSRDLSVATVYVGAISQNGSYPRPNLDILAKAAPFIRRELGARVRMRNLPELRFVHDESLERAGRIDQIINGINH